MKEKIKVLIADDNKTICEMINDFLKDFDDILILGIAYTDEDEIKMIEELKPEIVITDLMRSGKFTGFEIIKKYYTKKYSPEFLVISAESEELLINEDIPVAGYLQKPFFKLENIIDELRRIKKELTEI